MVASFIKSVKTGRGTCLFAELNNFVPMKTAMVEGYTNEDEE